MTDQLVKRFVAPTMTRALELVQRELGPEAVILSSKRVDKGVEIITSLEPDLPTRGIDVRREFGQNFDADVDTAMSSDSAWRSEAGIQHAAAKYEGSGQMNNAAKFGQKPPTELAREIEVAREKMFAAKRQAQVESEGQQAPSSPASVSNEQVQKAPTSQRREYSEVLSGGAPVAPPSTASSVAGMNPQDSLDRQQMESLQSEIADMRLLLEQQFWQFNERQSSAHLNGQVNMPQQMQMPKQFSVISQRLRRLGISEAMSEEIMAHCNAPRVSDAWNQCLAVLAKRIPISEASVLDQPGVYAFLGQTGVGKTTTIAKLAAQHVLKHGPGKVALVTTDTYRVGAYDQLRTMGKILNVPVRVVDRDNSLLTVLASLRQFPLVLIDTAGFRLGDPLLKAQLEQLESSPAIKRVAVLSCNSQLATMKASLHAHRGKRGLHSCILTKLDESASIGEALSLVSQAQVPVSYSTDGQDIPNDISLASGHGLVAKAVNVIKEQSEEQHPAVV
ncbi:MAG: flagellar biosynthesis protein FlhF [Agarilytica sp.]